MDAYIDRDEMRIYGGFAVRQLRAIVLHKTPELDTAVEAVAAHLEEATSSIIEIVERGRDADGVRFGAARESVPILARVRDYLGRFSSHLDAQAKEVDRRLFFPRTGRLTDERRAAPATLDLIARVAMQLSRSDTTVTDAARWRDEAIALRDELEPTLTTSASARATRRASTADGRAAEASWRATYRAAKCVAEAALILAGHVELLREVFYDLQVPADAKVTEPPKT